MDSSYSIPTDLAAIPSALGADLTKPDAIDLSHHLSILAKSRVNSPLKGLFKYVGRPGMTILAGGTPSPDYFPFDSLSAQALLPNTYSATGPASSFSWLWSLFSSPQTTTLSIPKHVSSPTPSSLQLATALQYSTAEGLLPLQEFVREFSAKVFQPGYANWTTLMNAGSTDAWSKICTTLLNKGDGVLCEEWTYPSALASAWPNGFSPVPIKMDGEGMTPEAFDELLGNWDVEARGGMPRPRVLYTVPVCQNPTGATMTAARKKKIYELAVKYDVIIVEDDPYYFLQAGEYEPRTAVRVAAEKKRVKKGTESDEEFLESLVPSYLKFDYQGRVVRIDTFSKTICPGSRLGWITANLVFCERFLRANETSTQAPCGFGQVLITKLLVEEWGMKGYFRWLKGLKAQYRERRDMLVDSLLDQSHAGLDGRQASNGVYELRVKERKDEKGFRMDEKTGEKPTILSFVAPEGGMFVWLRVHLSAHPSYPGKSTDELSAQLWEDIAEAGTLVAPGFIFSGENFPGTDSVQEKLLEVNGDSFFRISFSSATEEDMKTAAKTIGKATEEFFKKA